MSSTSELIFLSTYLMVLDNLMFDRYAPCLNVWLLKCVLSWCLREVGFVVKIESWRVEEIVFLEVLRELSRYIYEADEEKKGAEYLRALLS